MKKNSFIIRKNHLNKPDIYGYQVPNKNKVIVIKHFLKSQYQSDPIYLREIKILSLLSPHPNIVKFNETKNMNNACLLSFEYCNGGNLRQYRDYFTTKNKCFHIEKIKFILTEISKGLSYLHKNNLIHCNLCIEHILLNFPNGMPSNLEEDNHDLEVKICDFKNSIQIDSDNQKDLESFDKGIDLFGLGIICYYLYFGYLPFKNTNYQEQLKEEKYYFPIDKEIPVELITLIEKLLQKKHAESDIDKIIKENELFTKDVKDYKYIKIIDYVGNDYKENDFEFTILKENNYESLIKEKDTLCNKSELLNSTNYLLKSDEDKKEEILLDDLLNGNEKEEQVTNEDNSINIRKAYINGLENTITQAQNVANVSMIPESEASLSASNSLLVTTDQTPKKKKKKFQLIEGFFLQKK